MEHYFPPHGLIMTYPFDFGGKIVKVDVEAIDAPIDYNFILGHIWIHTMTDTLYLAF